MSEDNISYGEYEAIDHNFGEPVNYPKRDAHGNPETPWAIRCGAHGLVYLDRRQYDEQMNRANSLWYCPINPGMCESVYWDDDNFERFMEDDNLPPGPVSC